MSPALTLPLLTGLLVGCPGKPAGDSSVDTDTDTQTTDTDTQSDTADSAFDSDTQPDSGDTGDTAPVPCNPDDPSACDATQICCTPCCEEGAVAECTDPDIYGTCPLPDLTVDGGLIANSWVVEDDTFADTDCAVIEGCITTTGVRRVLRFSVSTPNLGTGALTLGVPEDHPDEFEWSDCHQHYHYSGYASYALLDSSGATTMTGRKQAFCLMDSAPVGPDATPLPYYTCGDEGLSIGWTDIYQSALDCQFIDVTGVPAGDYTLSVTVDPNNQLRELDDTNNTSSVTVTLPDPTSPPVCMP